MNSLRSSLQTAGLINSQMLENITKIKDRIRIINTQLNWLYKKPVFNCFKILQLEETKKIFISQGY